MRTGMRNLLAAGLMLLAVPAAAATDIVEVTSPGGITAWLAEDHTVPIVALDAAILGGTALDPEGREGAMGMMAGLLTEGRAPGMQPPSLPPPRKPASVLASTRG